MSREVMEQALDALIQMQNHNCTSLTFDAVTEALRAELAKPDEIELPEVRKVGTAYVALGSVKKLPLPSSVVDDSVESALNKLIPDGESTYIPEGWQLVPVEPTKQMIDEGCVAWRSSLKTKPDEQLGQHIKSEYAAMLKAAPKPGQADD